MVFKNTPDDLHDLALKEVLPRVAYCRKRFRGEETIVKDAPAPGGASPPHQPGAAPGWGGGPPPYHGINPNYAGLSGAAGGGGGEPAKGEKGDRGEKGKKGRGKGLEPGPASAIATSDKVYGRNGAPDKVIKRLEVGVDKIGLLIGRGGSKVKEIQETTGIGAFLLALPLP